MQIFPRQVREPYGDTTLREVVLKAQAWSALRILRRVGLETDDHHEICTSAEEAKRVAAMISDALKTVNSSFGASFHEDDHHRLCLCRVEVELGRITLMLGMGFRMLSYQRTI